MEIEKNWLVFHSFLCYFCKISLIFRCFRKNMKAYLNSIEKKHSFEKKNISSSIIFSQHFERIKFLNEDVKVNNDFDFKCLWSPKTKPEIGLPRFFFNFEVYLIEKSWGAFVSKNVRLPSKNGLWPTGVFRFSLHFFA